MYFREFFLDPTSHTITHTPSELVYEENKKRCFPYTKIVLPFEKPLDTFRTVVVFSAAVGEISVFKVIELSFFN